MVRTLVRCVSVGFLLVTIVSLAQTGASPRASLHALSERAKADGDTRAQRRAINLETALGKLKPSDLRGVRCGQGDKEGLHIDVDGAGDITGRLLDKGLERYLPALAAALGSAVGAGVITFLTPSKIGTDAVEILNSSDARPRSEVQNAARQLLQDTIPENFGKLQPGFMAKIVACSI